MSAEKCATCGHLKSVHTTDEYACCEPPCTFAPSPAACSCYQPKFEGENGICKKCGGSYSDLPLLPSQQIISAPAAAYVRTGTTPGTKLENVTSENQHPAAASEPRRYLRTYYGKENVEVIEAGAYDELAAALARLQTEHKAMFDSMMAKDSALAEALAQQNTDLTDLHQKIHAEDAEKLAEAEREAEDWYNKFANTDAALAEMQRQRDEAFKREAQWFGAYQNDVQRVANRADDLQRRLDEAVRLLWIAHHDMVAPEFKLPKDITATAAFLARERGEK